MKFTDDSMSLSGVSVQIRDHFNLCPVSHSTVTSPEHLPAASSPVPLTTPFLLSHGASVSPRAAAHTRSQPPVHLSLNAPPVLATHSWDPRCPNPPVPEMDQLSWALHARRPHPAHHACPSWTSLGHLPCRHLLSFAFFWPDLSLIEPRP